jgi:hypothetical protein
MLTLMLMRLLKIIMLTVIAAYVLPSEKGEASSRAAKSAPGSPCSRPRDDAALSCVSLGEPHPGPTRAHLWSPYAESMESLARLKLDLFVTAEKTIRKTRDISKIEQSCLYLVQKCARVTIPRCILSSPLVELSWIIVCRVNPVSSHGEHAQ